MFYVVGQGSEGPKRDPYARELQWPFPSECIIRKTDFPWHETGYVTPHFHDFVIYQLHVGVFFTPELPAKAGTFLDVARKIPHLASLGVTAIQLMPIQEFATRNLPRALPFYGTAVAAVSVELPRMLSATVCVSKPRRYQPDRRAASKIISAQPTRRRQD